MSQIVFQSHGVYYYSHIRIAISETESETKRKRERKKKSSSVVKQRLLSCLLLPTWYLMNQPQVWDTFWHEPTEPGNNGPCTDWLISSHVIQITIPEWLCTCIGRLLLFEILFAVSIPYEYPYKAVCKWESCFQQNIVRRRVSVTNQGPDWHHACPAKW